MLTSRHRIGDSGDDALVFDGDRRLDSPIDLTLGLWGVSAAFLLRSVGDFRYVGLCKKVRDSRFAWWDTRFFVPLCLTISWLAAVSAMSLV